MRDGAPAGGARPGALVTVAGAATLGLATVLPWRSIPGGELARGKLIVEGEPVPATGSVFASLPLTSAIVGVLVLVAVALGVLAARAHPLRAPVAVATGGFALLVLLLVVDRLFVARPAKDVTAVGMGGYLGVAGVAAIVLGAVLVVRPPRPRPRKRPRPQAPPPEPIPRSRWIAGGLTLLGAYLATRLAFADRFPYFIDEALWASHVQLADQSFRDVFVSLEFGHGPLLTALSLPWVKLGVAPLTAVRLVSVAAGLLTVGVVGVLARSLFGATVGWVAAALCVVLPFFVVHQGMGIYEPLVTLVMAGALALQVAFARRPRLGVAALLGAVLAAGILTKANTLPALLLLPVSLLCFDWSEQGRHARLTRWLQGAGLVTAMVFVADRLQRVSVYYDRLEEARQSLLLWPARSVSAVLDDPFAVTGLTWDTYRPALLGYVTIPLLVAALAGTALLWRERPKRLGLLLAWLLVPLAISMLFQLRPFPRHALYLVPPLIVLAAYALVAGARLARRRLTPRLATAVVAAGAAVALAPALVLDARVLGHPATARYPGLDHWQYVTGWPAGGPWSDAAAFVDRRDAGWPGDELVVLAPGRYTTLRLLLEAQGPAAIVQPDSPLASRARFAVYDTAAFPVDPTGFPAEAARRGFTPAGRFSRPDEACEGPRKSRCGGTVVVLER